MKKIVWRIKMLLGWICYWPVMIWPLKYTDNKLFQWLLPHAGFYAYDTGYRDHDAIVVTDVPF